MICQNTLYIWKPSNVFINDDRSIDGKHTRSHDINEHFLHAEQTTRECNEDCPSCRWIQRVRTKPTTAILQSRVSSALCLTKSWPVCTLLLNSQVAQIPQNTNQNFYCSTDRPLILLKPSTPFIQRSAVNNHTFRRPIPATATAPTRHAYICAPDTVTTQIDVDTTILNIYFYMDVFFKSKS